MFTLRGKQVAGVGPIMQEGQPPAWSTYIATDDADAAAERAGGAGASVLVEPMDMMDAGRLAVFAHPAAGVLGVWQAGPPHRRRAGQRARRAELERAADPRRRGRQGVRRGGLRLEARGPGLRRDDLHALQCRRHGSRGRDATPSEVPDEVPAFWLSLLRGRRLRRVRGQGPGARRPRFRAAAHARGRRALRGRRRPAWRDLRRHRRRAARGMSHTGGGAGHRLAQWRATMDGQRCSGARSRSRATRWCCSTSSAGTSTSTAPT